MKKIVAHIQRTVTMTTILTAMEVSVSDEDPNALAISPGGSAVATTNQNATALSQPTPLATATSKSSSKSAIDACVLLTKDDVNQVLGQAFEPLAGTGQYDICAYTFQLARIDLTITHTGGTRSMAITRTRLAEMALDVPGLGDEAFYNVNSSTLFVRKGDAMYVMSYLDSMVTQEDKIAKEKVLAGLLLGRLN